jgi:hypothetical protein
VSVPNQCLLQGAQPTWSLINPSGGYHLRGSEYHAAHSQSFPSSILYFPLVALLGREWLSTTRLLPVTYISNHSYSIILIHCGGKQGIRVRVTLMHLRFHRTPICKCTINAKSKVCDVKTCTMLCNRYLPCSKEERLVSVWLGECCPP